MNNAKAKKIGNIILNTLLYVFLVICILAVILTIFSKKDVDGAAEIFGYQMRIVTSDSMAKCEYTDVSDYEIGSIPVRSMIFVQMVPEENTDEWYRSLKVGDVLTFRYVYTTQVTITHRIIAITEKPSGGFVIKLAGDNTTSDSGHLYQLIDTSIPNSTDYVIGKVVGQSYIFGVIISLLMTQLGLILLIMVPCVIIIALEVVKIIKTFNADKKKREEEEMAKKDQELEELRNRLAELEKTKSNTETEEDNLA